MKQNNNQFLSELEKVTNETENAKGAKSNVSSLDCCVDLFGKIGSMRSRSEDEIISLFTKAFHGDPLKAMKILFWCRDIRGGAGERKIPRIILRYLSKNYPNVVLKNLSLIPEFGRWDDLFYLKDSKLWSKVVHFIYEQLRADMDNDHPTLLAKWMPSNNTSNTERVRMAKYFARKWGWSDKYYRKTLSLLRSKIDIVEKKMCANRWGEIVYEHVPSRAGMIYRKAFLNHDWERYQKYLQMVKEGKSKIKSGTLYPYDIIRNIMGQGYKNDETLDLQWQNLPDYVEPFNGLVVCDTSGSMMRSNSYGGPKNNQIAPIYVSVSLALYIAERNESIWKNKFITFDKKPDLQTIRGNNIAEKTLNLSNAKWGMNTDLQKVFDLILQTAIQNDVPQYQMPEKLFIISDMQFDRACTKNDYSNFEEIEKKYEDAGYKRPDLIFWNVNAYSFDSPVTKDDYGTALVSGASPSILKAALAGDEISPVEVMDEVIESQRYQKVSI